MRGRNLIELHPAGELGCPRCSVWVAGSTRREFPVKNRHDRHWNCHNKVTISQLKCQPMRLLNAAILGYGAREIAANALAHYDADRTKREIQAAQPGTRKAAAIVHVKRICVVCARPGSTKEIARRMRSAGYISRANDFEGYLRRVLRKSGQFVEASWGTWELRHPSVSETGVLEDFSADLLQFPDRK